MDKKVREDDGSGKGKGKWHNKKETARKNMNV